VGDLRGLRLAHTLNERPSCRSAKFTVVYALAHVLGALVLLVSLDLVNLVIDVEVMHALLLPIVLGFLLVLESNALPSEWRMRSPYKYVTWALCMIVIAFGLYMVPATFGFT
jgi:Mn2+/Fe2+ NRAMP family transporter